VKCDFPRNLKSFVKTVQKQDDANDEVGGNTLIQCRCRNVKLTRKLRFMYS